MKFFLFALIFSSVSAHALVCNGPVACLKSAFSPAAVRSLMSRKVLNITEEVTKSDLVNIHSAKGNKHLEIPEESLIRVPKHLVKEYKDLSSRESELMVSEEAQLCVLKKILGDALIEAFLNPADENQVSPSVHASEKGPAIYQAPAGSGGEKENQVGAAAAASNEQKMEEGIARQTRRHFEYQVLKGIFDFEGMHREAEKFYPNGWRLPSVKELEEIYSSHKNSFSRGFSFRSCERNDNDRCLRVFFEERTNRCQTCDDEQLLPVILLREVAAPSVHASEKGSAIYQAPAGFGGEKENQVGAAAAEAADSNERKMAEGIARETRKLEAMLDEDEDKPKSSVLICYTKSFKYQVLEGEFNLDGMHREAQRFYRDGWRLPSVEHLKEIYNRHKKYFTPGISFRSYERDEHNKCMRVFFDKGGSYTHTCTDTQPLPVILVREPAPLTVYLPDNWLTEGPVR